MEEEKRSDEPIVAEGEIPEVEGEPIGATEAEDAQKPASTPEEVEIPCDKQEDAGGQEPITVVSNGGQAETPENAPDDMRLIGERLEGIASTEQRLFSEVREMHKLYHTEFAGRLKSMQEELERYRKIDKGRIFDDILAAIARIYGNNETLAEEVSEPRAKKSIRYMLLDIEDLLNTYGMEKLRSMPGEKRNPRHCQILNRISTDDPEKHDTIAKSYNAGFFIGNRTVIKEVVDIYFYEAYASKAHEETDQPTEDSECAASN